MDIEANHEGYSDGVIEESEGPPSGRPVWIISHMCNSAAFLEHSLLAGANAIECDIECERAKDGRFVFETHHGFAGPGYPIRKAHARMPLRGYLEAMRDCAGRYPHYTLQYFDCKLRGFPKTPLQVIGDALAAEICSVLYPGAVIPPAASTDEFARKGGLSRCCWIKEQRWKKQATDVSLSEGKLKACGCVKHVAERGAADDDDPEACSGTPSDPASDGDVVDDVAERVDPHPTAASGVERSPVPPAAPPERQQSPKEDEYTPQRNGVRAAAALPDGWVPIYCIVNCPVSEDISFLSFVSRDTTGRFLGMVDMGSSAREVAAAYAWIGISERAWFGRGTNIIQHSLNARSIREGTQLRKEKKLAGVAQWTVLHKSSVRRLLKLGVDAIQADTTYFLRNGVKNALRTVSSYPGVRLATRDDSPFRGGI